MRFVLIAGLWLDGSAWDPVLPFLRDAGHEAIAVTLPGQGDGNAGATLDDQVAAIVSAIDAGAGPSVVVGHSAGCTLAWIAADRRPEKVSAVEMIGGFPTGNGGVYAHFFEPTDGQVPFPGWQEFEGPDSADLDQAARDRIAAAAIPLPATVQCPVLLSDERRFAIPVTLICPEFSVADARGWIDADEVPELTAAKHVSYVDIDTGHWPMFTQPEELARVIAAA